MNSRAVGIFAIVVAIIVGVAIWFLNSDYAPHAVAGAQGPSFIPAPPTPTPAPVKATESRPPTPPPTPAPKEIVGLPKPPAIPPVAPAMTEDDRKIDEILRINTGNTDADNAAASQRLIAILPTLTPDGQVECISHINNLLPDEQYKTLMPIWKNPNFNPDVLEAILTDLMNRDDKIKLPSLLEAVKIPNHPSRDEAKSTLEVFLDEDFGDDTAKWEKGVQAYLKKQAEEEAATPPEPK